MRQKTTTNLSPKREKYRNYFQVLINELREKHKFTGARAAQPANWYTFASGIQGISYSAAFAKKEKTRVYISIYQKLRENRIELFDAIENRKAEIESNFDSPLKWERNAEKQETLISMYRDGDIEKSSDSELEEIRKWHIANLLKLKKAFQPEIEKALETLDSSEKEES